MVSDESTDFTEAGGQDVPSLRDAFSVVAILGRHLVKSHVIRR